MRSLWVESEPATPMFGVSRGALPFIAGSWKSAGESRRRLNGF